MSTVLMMVRSAPFAGLRAREAADAALLFSAFTPALAVLFSADGVWQLLPEQHHQDIDAVPVAPVLAAFHEYDIHAVYADGRALAERGISATQLMPGVAVLDDAGIQALLAGHDRVLTF